MVFLWGTLTFPRPSKTFWITMVAYTQTIILLKCVSQFKILWWNSAVLLDNQPLAGARILGIERKANYATYDLVLLLFIFLHRIILKSFGLWRSVEIEENLLEGCYKIVETDENTKSLLKLQRYDIPLMNPQN